MSTQQQEHLSSEGNNSREVNYPASSMELNNNSGISQQQSSCVSMNASGQSSLSSTNSSNSSSNTNNETKLLSSNADYDNIRNTTLFFFLDRLYIASHEGKEARTLHDLSCLFGTKEFTKEMRQIVGASRNGLKRFLESYPSLFTIEGDKVYLTQLKQEATIPSRDYNKEAANYFRQKLLQFGNSLVPIKNLFGYRSQASQEVRHVSGKNARDFKQFLRAHDDIFVILADEHVVLKSALHELESMGQLPVKIETNSVASDESAMDPYLNKQFAHTIEDCIERIRKRQQAKLESKDSKMKDAIGEEETVENFRIQLERLHEIIQQDCTNELFLKMVKTIEDLKVFLRMHPKLFKRFKCDKDGRDYVSLLTEEERKEFNIFGGQTASNRQHSTLERTQTIESQSSEGCQSFQQPMSLPKLNKMAPDEAKQPTTSHLREQQSVDEAQESSRSSRNILSSSSSSVQATSQPPANKLAKKMEPHLGLRPKVESGKIIMPPADQVQFKRQSSVGTHSKQQLGSSHQHQRQPQRQLSSELRANAPPFVPSKPKDPSLGPRQNSHLSSATMVQASQPMSSSSTAMPRSLSNLGPRSRNVVVAGPTSMGLVDQQRGAIRNYLMRAQSGDKSSANSNIFWSSSSSAAAAAASASANSMITSSINAKQQPAPNNGISASKPSGDYLRARTIDVVREASNIISRIMNTTDAVAFDCKGYNLGLDGQITLIQFGYIPNKMATSLTDKLERQTTEALIETNDENREKPLGRPKPEVCVFDLITNPELAYCLKPLLESESVVKVVHDVRNKSNALFVQFDIVLKNVFDTQVANLVIQQQDTGKPAYKSRYISMSRLCEVYGDDELLKYRDIIKSKTRHSASCTGPVLIQSATTAAAATTTTPISSKANSASRIKDANYWRTRPLTKPMIYESTMDVYCLVGGIYQNLRDKIKLEYMPLFDQLNVENVLARIKPDEIRSAKKERKIDLEVIDLKRKLYSDSKGSIVLSNRELRLLRHIDLTEEVRSKIQQCKKVAKKIERLDMKAAQQLQSLNSQMSSVGDKLIGDEQDGTNSRPLDQTSNQLSLSHSIDGSSNGEESLKKSDDVDEATTQVMMSNLMESSMFDELKDKMIESSSLLDSLEDDDDKDVCQIEGGNLSGMDLNRSLSNHSHGGSNNGTDCCRCQCHRSSVSETESGQFRSNLSLKSSFSSIETPNIINQLSNIDSTSNSVVGANSNNNNNNLTPQEDDSRGKEASQEIHSGSDSSEKSAVVDMAIQCDLLS